ncbi:MAG: dienelactone hydrolase family protein [Actinomycetes bacterium]
MGQSITFPSNGDSCTGYLSLPAGGSGPALIVIQEWWGLVGHIKDVVDRFAQAGFVALAPDLYHGEIAEEPDVAKKLLMEMQMKKAAHDIAGAANYLVSRSDVSATAVGAIGFCMGGSLALWSATFCDAIGAAVGFYPGGSWERMAPVWSGYAGKVAQIHCAHSDGTSAAPGIQEAVTSIIGAGGQVQTFDYPNTAHAFFNDDRPEVFDAPAAALAWERTVEFFKNSLK